MAGYIIIVGQDPYNTFVLVCEQTHVHKALQRVMETVCSTSATNSDPLRPRGSSATPVTRRVISQRNREWHTNPSLHWRMVAACTGYKTLTLTFKTAKGMAPSYVQSLINPYNPTRPLRSVNTGMLTVPSLKTLGQKSSRPRQFALLAPKLWNDLPVALRTAVSLPSFCRGLKTHLFRLRHSP